MGRFMPAPSPGRRVFSATPSKLLQEKQEINLETAGGVPTSTSRPIKSIIKRGTFMPARSLRPEGFQLSTHKLL